MMHAPLPLPDTACNPTPAATPERDYLDSISLIEQLHRLLHDLIKDEFERLGISDLTPVQAMLVYNLGASEVTAGELRSRGMYQGSNVSYNLKKLVLMDYVCSARCDLDRRSIRVSLTPRGVHIREVVLNLFRRHAEALSQSGVLDDPPLAQVNGQLRRVARYWGEQIRYIY